MNPERKKERFSIRNRSDEGDVALTLLTYSALLFLVVYGMLHMKPEAADQNQQEPAVPTAVPSSIPSAESMIITPEALQPFLRK